MLLIVLYECETWTFALREGYILHLSENKGLWKIFGPKKNNVGNLGYYITRNLGGLRWRPGIVKVVQFRKLLWAVHVTGMVRKGMHIQFW
jgi:hypothetical protein